MKNKKIILGLGTITALGAMSVGFIACVKEKEVKAIVDEKTKDLSKLKKEDLDGDFKVLKDKIAELEKLQKEAANKDKYAPILSALIRKYKNEISEGFTKIVEEFLNQPKEKDDNIRKNSDIGHFESGSKVKDVIDRIKNVIKSQGWDIVEDPTHDKANSGFFGDEVEKNGRELLDNESSINFKLKTKFYGYDIQTNDLTFNFVVGKKMLNTFNDIELEAEVSDIDGVVKALNQQSKFKNISLENKDLREVKVTIEPQVGTPGKIKISASNNSKKLSGEVALILKAKRKTLEKKHIDTGFVATNNTSIDDVITMLKKHDDLKTITNNDLDIKIVKAKIGQKGGIKITPKPTSTKIKGNSLIIDIAALPKVGLDAKHLGTKKAELSKNDLTVDEVLKVLNDHKDFSNDQLTKEDIELEETKATTEKPGEVKIKAKDGNEKISGEITLTIPKLNN